MKEYLNLLIRRESRDVVGKRWANAWMLMLMLLAMFASIAFSNGSMNYLSVKMNDPFTNWVNITNEFGSDHFDEFVDCLTKEEMKERFHFDDVQTDHTSIKNFRARSGNVYTLDTRFFERPNSKLVRAILDPSNVVNGTAISPERLVEHTFGFIMTRDALGKLGYDIDDVPAYIMFHTYSVGADTLGVELDAEGFAAAPVPVLGVVERLPDNKDLIAARYFLEQYQNTMDYTLNLNNESYQRSLIFYVPSPMTEEEFASRVEQAMPDSVKHAFTIIATPNEKLESWKPGEIYTVYFNDENNMPTQLFNDVARAMASSAEETGIVRLYDYTGSDHQLPESQFLSVNFTNLDSIRSFEHFAKDNFGVKIEMTQVNAKENFHEVSLLATVLSWVMIVFSIVSIVIFIVNMLQNYFKKVSRNIGTFKAFGIDSTELLKAYEFLLLGIVAIAMIVALLLVWCTQIILPLLGVMKGGEFNYLDLWSSQSFIAAAIVIAATVVTVALVMNSLLRRTPGNLIYDR